MGKYIVCTLEDESYAVAVESVQSIEYLRPITRVPGTRPFVRGVMNLRGVITAVVDLRVLFDLDTQEPTKESRIIIVSDDTGVEVGWLVDTATNVHEVDVNDILLPDASGPNYISGLIRQDQRVIAVLDVDKLLESNNAMSKESDVSGDAHDIEGEM